MGSRSYTVIMFLISDLAVGNCNTIACMFRSRACLVTRSFTRQRKFIRAARCGSQRAYVYRYQLCTNQY